MEYIFETLWDDIQDSLKTNKDDGSSSDKAERELPSKLIVMQMLISQANKYKAVDYNDEAKLRNAIDVEVSRDEFLSGYVFFVSQNPHFDYTWSYMRKRKKSYIEFLVKAVMFLKHVVSDINVLIRESQKWNDIHFVFNDIFDVSFIPEKPYAKVGVQWENFYCLSSIDKYYNVVVKSREVVLVVRDGKNLADIVDIINERFQIGATKSDS